MTIAEKIKSARERAGLRATEAAARAGMTPQTWNDLERGRNANPSVATLRKIATGMGGFLVVDFALPKRRRKKNS